MRKKYRPTLPASLAEMRELELQMLALSDDEKKSDEWLEFMRYWAENDLFFMSQFVLSTRHWRHAVIPDPYEPDLGRRYLWHPFIFDRCRDLQFDEHDVLDLWSREHLKTTLGTLGRNLHRLVEDLPGSREQCIAIISETKGLAENFIKPIRDEMEENALLPALWPEVFWKDPPRQAKEWSISAEPNAKFTVKRASVGRKEATFEAIGLERLPIGPHWDILNYDDPVTPASVTNEAQMAKLRDQWKASLSLGREGGKRVYKGTFYHRADLWAHILDEGKARARVFPCWTPPTITGSPQDRQPTFYPIEYLEDKLKQAGSEEFGIQWLCDPHAGQTMKFQEEWLKFYSISPDDFIEKCTLYLLVDNASSDKEFSQDYTVVQMWAVGPDGKCRLVDAVRDRLNPTERIQAIIDMWEGWAHSGFQEARVETYGLDETIHWLEKEQERQCKIFPVVRVGGGSGPRRFKSSSGKKFKPERIENRLMPAFQRGDILLPETLVRKCKYANGANVDLIHVFRQHEYMVYPLCQHDDFLDTMSRLFEPDMPLVLPTSRADRKKKRDRYALGKHETQDEGDWVAPAVSY